MSHITFSPTRSFAKTVDPFVTDINDNGPSCTSTSTLLAAILPLTAVALVETIARIALMILLSPMACFDITKDRYYDEFVEGSGMLALRATVLPLLLLITAFDCKCECD
ncbi:MAG: hypothetical protein HY860_05305 [Chlamydiales bacterium]|nr:hypothetical protein [Chlamydiales bacterium]